VNGLRSVIAALVGTTILLAFGVLAAPAASATITCYGSTCNGLDPTTTYSATTAGKRCDAGAYTPYGASVSTSVGILELRYGPYCNANWAKITSSSPGTWFYVQNQNGDSQQMYVPPGHTSGYSDMVNGAYLARAGNAVAYTGWF
jgi:hypothetical protein